MFPTGFIFGSHEFTPRFHLVFVVLPAKSSDAWSVSLGLKTGASALIQGCLKENIIIFVGLFHKWTNEQINKHWTENPTQYSLAQDTEAFFFFINEISPWQRRKKMLYLSLFYSRLYIVFYIVH